MHFPLISRYRNGYLSLLYINERVFKCVLASMRAKQLYVRGRVHSSNAQVLTLSRRVIGTEGDQGGTKGGPRGCFWISSEWVFVFYIRYPQLPYPVFFLNLLFFFNLLFFIFISIEYTLHIQLVIPSYFHL